MRAPPRVRISASHPGIEKWAKYKEDYHLRFRWTPRRIFDVLFWGLAIPYGCFRVMTNEQEETERVSGRHTGQFLGGSNPKW